jgi:hypothetical protein
MSGFRSLRDHELHQLRAVVGFEGSNDALIEWLTRRGWLEEDQGDVREAVHIEAREPLVSGDVWSVVKEQDDVAQLFLALTCTRRHETLNAVETFGFVDVSC